MIELIPQTKPKFLGLDVKPNPIAGNGKQSFGWCSSYASNS